MTSIGDEVHTTIRRFVLERFPETRARGLRDDDSLLTSGFIDSLGILDLATFIDEEFGLNLDDADLTPENFDSIAAIARLVDTRRS